MSNFAVVTYLIEKRTELYGNNIFMKLYRRLSDSFKKQNFDEMLQINQLYDDVCMCHIRLPYTIDELERMGRNRLGDLRRFIFKIYSENQAKNCILPDNLSKVQEFGEDSRNSFTGRFLFKSLLTNILDEIYTNRGVKISDLDVSIIQGDNFDELRAVVSLLSPLVKYITIVTNDKSMAEESLRQVYEDTGLPIMITSDFYCVTKSSDCIISLGNSCVYHHNLKMKTKTVLINYGDPDVSKYTGNNIVINGIEIGLPVKIISKIDRNIYDFFGRCEIAEIILLHKLNMSDHGSFSPIDSAISDVLSKEFKKCGFSITGLKGRHNIIRISDISKN